MGKVRAASVGAREITFAAAAATLAIVAIFLPVAFMKGIIGKFFFQFGVTISVAVLISLLEALTLAPMRCSRFLEVGERRGRFGQAVDRTFARLSAGYLRALKPALHHRAWVLAGRDGVLRALPRHHQAAEPGVRARPGQQPVPDPLPDPGGHQPRRHRARDEADRGVPDLPRRGRGQLQLHRRLRRRRGQHRDDVHHHAQPGTIARWTRRRDAASASRSSWT